MFYLTSVNSAGYKSAWCKCNDWFGIKNCGFHFRDNPFRAPTIKTWRTRGGAERWLDERPGMRKYATIEEVPSELIGKPAVAKTADKG